MSGPYKDPIKIELFPLPVGVRSFALINQIKEPWDAPNLEPLDFLLAVMRSEKQPTLTRMAAAQAAAPYRHRGYRPG
jgi:hypothetical protein